MLRTSEKAIMIIIGARPEAIKMAPVYLALKRARLPVVLCVTCYNDPVIIETLSLFAITPDIILPVAACTENFLTTMQAIIESIKNILNGMHPCLVLVHGDSVSSVAVAMAAFYFSIPVAHVEAGLRTDDLLTPFPDEMHRRMLTVVSRFHFAPTMTAVSNIVAQGVNRELVFCTGSTSADALMIIKDKIIHKEIMLNEHIVRTLTGWRDNYLSVGLITLGHEKHTDQEMSSFFGIIKSLILDKQDCAWIIVHADNKGVVEKAIQIGFDMIDTILLVNSLSYGDMVHILDHVDIVLTDSGTVQEEAVSLGKPVLILRHKTERMEGVHAGQAHVVGFSPLLIMNGIERALYDELKGVSSTNHPYGDTYAAEKIAAFVQVRYPELVQTVLMHKNNYYQQKEV